MRVSAAAEKRDAGVGANRGLLPLSGDEAKKTGRCPWFADRMA
jgi:hypothetical protein